GSDEDHGEQGPISSRERKEQIAHRENGEAHAVDDSASEPIRCGTDNAGQQQRRDFAEDIHRTAQPTLQVVRNVQHRIEQVGPQVAHQRQQADGEKGRAEQGVEIASFDAGR
ncbi:MAG: hypothetical protein ACK55I_09760, partial [bacterium]